MRTVRLQDYKRQLLRVVRISDFSESAAMANHLVGRSAGTPPRALFENLLETLWRNAPQNTWAPETVPK
jgi:hypothetical protein